jgi:DNA-binding NarL/FixJ family response regulator
VTSPAAPVVVAFVDDLMDRSRLQRVPGITFTRDPAACADATVVVVDLARHAAVIPEVARVAPRAKVIAFGSHVDTAAFAAAERAGAACVLPRSKFLGDPSRVILSVCTEAADPER